eukprot:scaffold88507_cov26-Prasinocladus_malaysianus.AAC.1
MESRNSRDSSMASKPSMRFGMLALAMLAPMLCSGALVEYTLVVEEAIVSKPGVPFSRWGVVINGTTPGPTLQADEGDEVAITIINEMSASAAGTSLHWHGMFQPGTPFSDGVPGVTQCHIAPGTSLLVRFTATPAGTHWYHSHSGTQYVDGALGALIVHPKVSDGPAQPAWVASVAREEVLLAQEWNEKTGAYEYDSLRAGVYLGGTVELNGAMHMLGDVAWPETWLANGEVNPTFYASVGETTRFRFINAAGNYQLNLRTSGLSMRLVAVDPGTFVEPTDLDVISAQIGERYDFLLSSQSPGIYPIYISDAIGLNHTVLATFVVMAANG